MGVISDRTSSRGGALEVTPAKEHDPIKSERWVETKCGQVLGNKPRHTKMQKNNNQKDNKPK